MIEVDGYRVLADPVWSERCSPSRAVARSACIRCRAALEALPAVDAVIISHDHYDHLDVDTIRRSRRTQRAASSCHSVSAHICATGTSRRTGSSNWTGTKRAQVGDLSIVCTPARHFSGRFLTRNTTLWSSWAVIGPRHRVFFGGDTGYSRSFAEVGADRGPFDLTLMPVGAYHPGWPDIHMNPEEAVRAHLDVTDAGKGLFVPIHWATFRLAPHPWSQPIERLLAAAGPARVTVEVPRPGGRVEPGSVQQPAEPPWWRS